MGCTLLFPTPPWMSSATRHVDVSICEVLFGMQGANALDVVLSCLGWGRILLPQQGAGGEHAPITHEPLLDILFVSTSICTSRGPMAAEEVVLLSQKELAQKQHITALSNPLLVPCRHLLPPLQLPLSLILYRFPASSFSHQWNRNQPCCGPTPAAGWANQQGCRTSAISCNHTDNPPYSLFIPIILGDTPCIFSFRDLSAPRSAFSFSSGFKTTSCFPLSSPLSPLTPPSVALILPHSLTNTLEHKHTYMRTHTHTPSSPIAAVSLNCLGANKRRNSTPTIIRGGESTTQQKSASEWVHVWEEIQADLRMLAIQD